MELDLSFLRWGYYPHYECSVDQLSQHYYCIEFVGAGGIDIQYDDRRFILEGQWFWLLYPGPQFHYKPSAQFGWWSTRYLVIAGELADHWMKEGLLPVEPQPAPAISDYGARLDHIMLLASRPDSLGYRHAVNKLEGILLELMEARRSTNKSPAWFGKVMGYLQEHCHETIDYQQLAEESQLSLRTLQRQFFTQMHVSLHEYKLQLRMTEARKLLDTTNLPTKVIAERLGYANVHYFSRQFNQMTGITPGQFRNSRKCLP